MHELRTGRRKTAFCLLAGFTLTVGVCVAAEPEPTRSVRPIVAPAPSLAVAADTNTPPLWFPVGEQLRFRIYWGAIPVGEIQSTSSWVEVKGQRLLEATYRARSNRVLRQIYPVDDVMVTTIDPVNFLPVCFRMDMKEGSHIRLETTTFDYAAGKAVWRATVKNKTREYAIDRETHDLLSLLYFLRKEGFQSGSNRIVRVLAERKVRDLTVVVGGHEIVKVPGLGAVDCLRLRPNIDFEGLFVSSGALTFCVSADARCICTRAKVSIPVGSITAELIEWTRPNE